MMKRPEDEIPEDLISRLDETGELTYESKAFTIVPKGYHKAGNKRRAHLLHSVIAILVYESHRAKSAEQKRDFLHVARLLQSVRIQYEDTEI